MNIQVNFELTDKEIEFILFVEEYLARNPLQELGDIPFYMFNDRNLTEAIAELYRKDIIIWDDPACGYVKTYLFDEILKQLSR
jgi:hypothetical protein